MSTINLSNQVAVVTGAGRGLGREYARTLGQYGALLMLNDNAIDELGRPLVHETAKEIELAGGCVITNTDDLSCKTGCQNLIRQVEENYGFADIFIHNAGNIIDKSFLEYEDNDWFHVMNIHLSASYYLLKGILPLMAKKSYGRIVMVTSSNGMYGLKGQASYAAAKMGVFGLARALNAEFGCEGIKFNLLSPLAATEQTKDAIKGVLADKLHPNKVAPLIGYLCSEQCEQSGKVFVAAGGYFSVIGFFEGEGVYIPEEELTAERVFENIDKITDLSNAKYIASAKQEGKTIFRKIL